MEFIFKQFVECYRCSFGFWTRMSMIAEILMHWLYKCVWFSYRWLCWVKCEFYKFYTMLKKGLRNVKELNKVVRRTWDKQNTYFCVRNHDFSFEITDFFCTSFWVLQPAHDRLTLLDVSCYCSIVAVSPRWYYSSDKMFSLSRIKWWIHVTFLESNGIIYSRKQVWCVY